MPQAGWYPDPAGDPTRCRFFDGTAWTDEVRPTAEVLGPSETAPGQAPSSYVAPGQGPSSYVAPQPTTPTDTSAHRPADHASGAPSPAGHWGAPPPQQPTTRTSGRGRQSMLRLVSTAALLSVAASVGAQMWWRTRPASTPTTPAPVVTPSARPASPTPSLNGTDPVGEFTCSGGSVAYSSKQPAYTSYGLTIQAPSEWGVRFDRSQWTWLHDAAAWGKNLKDPSGIALGGVRRDHGFTWENALEHYATCLQSPGALGGAQIRELERGDTTLAGKRAQQVTFVASDESQETWHRLYVVDTGVYGGYATLFEFAPNNPASIAEVQRVTDAATAG